MPAAEAFSHIDPANFMLLHFEDIRYGHRPHRQQQYQIGAAGERSNTNRCDPLRDRDRLQAGTFAKHRYTDLPHGKALMGSGDHQPRVGTAFRAEDLPSVIVAIVQDQPDPVIQIKAIPRPADRVPYRWPLFRGAPRDHGSPPADTPPDAARIAADTAHPAYPLCRHR